MVEKVSVILDPTLNTLKSTTGEFIISHHPLIFSPLKSLDHDIKYKVKVLLSKEQTFYAAHTNLDFAEKGISWALAQRIGLQEDDGSTPQIRTGNLPYGSVHELIDSLVAVLEKKVIKVVGHKEEIGRVAALPGSGFSEDMIEECYDRGIGTIISGDLKHHSAIKGMDLGITLIDAGHRETEFPGVQFLAGYLENELEGVDVELIRPAEPWTYEIDHV